MKEALGLYSRNEVIKVVTVIDILEGGGKERRLIELFKGFDRFGGVESDLIILSNRVGYRDINKVNTKIHMIERNPLRDLSIFFKLYAIFRDIEPDIIQCWDLFSAVFALPAAKFLGIKFVNASISHAPDYIRPFSKNWIRAKLTFPFSDAIVANSKAGLNSYNLRTSKAIFIHNGFDITRILHLKDTRKVKDQLNVKTSKVVGMIGAFRDRKDYETYINASIEILKEIHDITFLGIGGGEKLNDMRKMIPHKYKDRIILPGPLNDVESVVNIFNVGVLATFTEGISNTIIEYMVLAKPVVATDGGGTKELIQDGITGFLVPVGSVGHLKEKIIYLLTHAQVSESMGQQGRMRILKEFNLENMTRKYLELYKRLI